MDFVETEGDTIDTAIENALKALGVGREKITVDIISEGRKGILGFGAQKAKIRASLRKLNIEPDAAPAKPQAVQAPTRAAEPRSRPPERRAPEPRRPEPPRPEPRAKAQESRPRTSDRPRPEPRVDAAPRPSVAPRPQAETRPVDAPPPPTSAEAAAMVEKAKVALAEILNLMGMNASVEQKAGVDADETILEVTSDNSGLLIGRKGQTSKRCNIWSAASPASGLATTGRISSSISKIIANGAASLWKIWRCAWAKKPSVREKP